MHKRPPDKDPLTLGNSGTTIRWTGRRCFVQIRRPAQAAVTRLVIGTVTLGLFVAGVSAQTPATPAFPAASAPTGPTLQAELLKTIDASHAKAGDEVTARIVAPVEFDGAKYPAGAVVLGHVTKVDPTCLVLLFDHIEVKKNAPAQVGLSLRAVMMPHSSPRSTGDQISPRAQGAGGSGVDPAISAPRGRGEMLRSPQAAVEDSANTVFQGPRSVPAGNGSVVGLPGVNLAISSDPKAGATFEADKDQKMKLEKGLQIIFVMSK